jgi:hypothetical protein
MQIVSKLQNKVPKVVNARLKDSGLHLSFGYFVLNSDSIYGKILTKMRYDYIIK